MVVVGFYVETERTKLCDQLLGSTGTINEEGWAFRQLRRNIR